MQHRTIELRRDGRAAEGAPLLREYGFKKPIEGSNPSLSARKRNTRLVRVFRFLLGVRTLAARRAGRGFDKFAGSEFGRCSEAEAPAGRGPGMVRDYPSLGQITKPPSGGPKVSAD